MTDSEPRTWERRRAHVGSPDADGTWGFAIYRYCGVLDGALLGRTVGDLAFEEPRQKAWRSAHAANSALVPKIGRCAEPLVPLRP